MNEAGNGTVQWDVDARGVATVALNRPHVNNAYDGDLVTDIHEALDALGAQPGLRAVVIRGNGRHFQAGADLTWLDRVARESAEENVRVSHATGDAVRRLDGVPVPTIALVHGACIGGGTGIIAACDVVVASEDAIFAISESRWGMMAGVIFPQLVQAIGLRQLRRYAITGERLDAREAQRIGLVHEVVPTGGLDEAGERIVSSILANAPGATTSTKLRALAVAGAFVDDGLFRDLVDEHARTRQGAEAFEGRASFVEKRAASWQPE
ncbi:MAG: enoyl-CoA hydratase-related protein [Thermoleophilia bacterium]